MQGHYGEQDAFYPVDDARALEQQIRDEAGVDVEFFYYPAGHAFHNDKDRLGTYDAESADAGLVAHRRLPALAGELGFGS